MGGELVAAEASWLDVVKSVANAAQHEDVRLYPNITLPTWIDQLHDPNDKVQNPASSSSDLLRPLALNNKEVSRSTEIEEQALIQELKRILQQPDRLSKESFLGLLGSHLGIAKQDELTPSKGSPARKRNGLVDTKEEQSTIKLLRKSCRHFGHRLVTLILECAVSLSFWAPVHVLLDRRVVDSNSSVKLVQSLVEDEQPRLLCLYITNVPDLRPQDVYTLLTYLLDSIPNPSKSFRFVKSEWRRVASAEIERVVQSRGAIQTATTKSMFHSIERLSRGHDSAVSSAIGLAMAIDGFSSPELCIHHLVSSGPDEAVISFILPQLSTAQVLRLIRYLRRWIEMYSSHLENFPVPKSGRVPSFEQVLSWVGLVLEGQFTQFVLSADFHDELRSMRDMIHSLVDFGANLSPLGGITEHIKSQGLLPVRKQQGDGACDYVIELLDLS